MGFQKVEHEQPGLALIELVDEVREPALADLLGGDRGPVDERQVTAVAGDQSLGLEPIEQSCDRGVRPLTPRTPQGFQRLTDSRLPSVPKNLQDVKFGIGNRWGTFGHWRSSRQWRSDMPQLHTWAELQPDCCVGGVG